MMGVIGVSPEMSRNIKGLLVDGAKFTASGDLEKAVQCYARVLDLESQKPEPYVLLARCLYRIGLKNNDMFGGGGEEEEISSEEEDDDEEDDQDETAQAPAVNSRLYQFDHEEEDMEGGKEKLYQEDIGADEDQPGEELEEAMSPGDGFSNYLGGDVFENAMELLYRARIMYMDSSKPSEQLPVKVQTRLAEIYELLGDIDQELEDFSQAVRDYEEAIRLCKQVSEKDSETVLDIYMKLAEALRWLDTENYENMTRDQHKEFLLQVSSMLKNRIKHQKSSDIEEDEARLERITEDLQTLEAGKNSAATPFNKESMMQAILKQALEATQQGKVNDLSKMVKKNKKKKTLKKK